MRQQPGEQRAVDVVGRSGRVVDRAADVAQRLAQLAGEVLPLAHAHVVQVLGVAHPAKAVARELLLLRAQVAPEVQVGEEVRARLPVDEARVLLVGLAALLGGADARVLDRQRGGDHDDLVAAAVAVGFEDHPPDPRVDRELCEPAAQAGQPLARVVGVEVQSAEFVQQRLAVADLAAVGRVEEAEVLDLAERQRLHLQDHRREARAQDLGIGERGPVGEVRLGVQADADAVRRAPAAAHALVGRRLRDGLDRQPLDLQPRAVAADPRGARIDDRTDPRHGERRLGDVRREHDAARGVRLEDLLLLGRREARVERQDLDVVSQAAGQRLGGVTDLALAGEEDEHVAGRVVEQLLDGVADRVDRVVLLGGGPVADRDGVRAPGDLDDGRAAEMLAEAGRVDRRARDDELEVRTPGQQLLEEAEQEVDVQAALVGLVDDDRVVAAQQPVALDLGEQQAVGDEPHQRLLPGLVVEAHAVADGAAERDLELVGDPLRDGACGDPPRLGVGDRGSPELEADLRQLGRLARAGLAGDDHDLVGGDRGEQVVAAGADRQVGRIADLEVRRDRHPADPG